MFYEENPEAEPSDEVLPKEKMFHHTRHVSVDAFTAELEDYMCWYNHIRIQLRLDGLSPIEYRNRALAASKTI